MTRKMIWVRSAQMQGWVCSECAWAFNDSGPPRGESLDEMARSFERKRDQEFAAHVCARHPRPAKPKGR
jgi:hypothetical protein